MAPEDQKIAAFGSSYGERIDIQKTASRKPNRGRYSAKSQIFIE
jgi:hypothetical protein